jgi:hypothetical protein
MESFTAQSGGGDGEQRLPSLPSGDGLDESTMGGSADLRGAFWSDGVMALAPYSPAGMYCILVS